VVTLVWSPVHVSRKRGHEVVCTDIDEKRIAQLQAGGVPIYEHHLDKILESALAAGRISYTSDAGGCDTQGRCNLYLRRHAAPKKNGDADLSAIDHVARQIATEARSSKLVIEKSTVPARTGLELRSALTAYSRKQRLYTFRVASNPEFLREGTAVSDFFPPGPYRGRSGGRELSARHARNLPPNPGALVSMPGAQWHVPAGQRG